MRESRAAGITMEGLTMVRGRRLYCLAASAWRRPERAVNDVLTPAQGEEPGDEEPEDREP